MSARPEAEISAVVLAKDRSGAKTRLVRDRGRAADVALELACMTVRTTLAAGCSRSVFVVTSDEAIAREASSMGAVVVPEGRPVGINGAAALGRRRALATHPDIPVAVLVADLPQLTVGDLEAVAAEHDGHRTPLFVADHLGDGTTCLLHAPDRRPGLAFGRSSASMHRRLGYVPAQRPLRGLRLDLDTPEDVELVTQDQLGLLSMV